MYSNYISAMDLGIVLSQPHPHSNFSFFKLFSEKLYYYRIMISFLYFNTEATKTAMINWSENKYNLFPLPG